MAEKRCFVIGRRVGETLPWYGSSRAHYERFADTDRRARVAPCAAIAAVAVAVAVATGRQVEMRQEVISREEMREGARDQRPC